MNRIPALLRTVFTLEGARTVALCRLGRVAGAEAVLEDVDQRLDTALSELQAHGCAYPAHAIAQRYGFGQPDYLVLQLALLPWHGEAMVRDATNALGEARSDGPRASHAIALALPGYEDWGHALSVLTALTVFSEGIVEGSPCDDGDLVLAPGLATRELMGLRELPRIA